MCECDRLFYYMTREELIEAWSKYRGHLTSEEVQALSFAHFILTRWHDAHGDHLPELDREVIVLIQDYEDDPTHLRVSFGHRPNPKGWTGKSLSTGKIEHYTPKTFGKGGWNLDKIKYWLDVELPIKYEEE